MYDLEIIKTRLSPVCYNIFRVIGIERHIEKYSKYSDGELIQFIKKSQFTSGQIAERLYANPNSIIARRFQLYISGKDIINLTYPEADMYKKELVIFLIYSGNIII